MGLRGRSGRRGRGRARRAPRLRVGRAGGARAAAAVRAADRGPRTPHGASVPRRRARASAASLPHAARTSWCARTTRPSVLRALERADAEDLAVTPYGGGTSVVGGVDPVPGPRHDGAMSLDLGRLDRVLEVDPVSRAARIQAGATGPRIERAARRARDDAALLPAVVRALDARRLDRHPRGRALRHRADAHRRPRRVDPRGHGARRACGSRGGCPASGAGPSPDRLLLGSEGTLAVITEAWVRIRPRDEPRWSARVELDDFAAGLELIREIVQSGLRPSNCRLIDGARGGADVRRRRTRAAVPGLRGRPRAGRAPRKRRAHGEPSPRAAAGAWREAFLRAPYLRDTLVAMGVLTETFETAVTWDRLRASLSPTRCKAGGPGERGHLPDHARVPGRRGAVLHRARAGASRRRGGAVGRDQGAPPPTPSSRRAARSPITTRSGATTAPGTTVSARSRSRSPLRAAKAALDPGSRLNPGVLLDT